MGWKRRRPQAEAEVDVDSAVGVFSHCRASDERALDGIKHTGRKRRRGGLNTHFDRLLGSLNVLPLASSSVGSSRARSSSLSSISAPKTPADGYRPHGLKSPRKGRRPVQEAPAPPSPCQDYRKFGLQELPEPANESQLPPWLADTFLSLNQEHPLRALLPDECHFTPDPKPYEAPRIASSNTFEPVLADTTEMEPTIIEEETVFAFHPPEPNSNLSMNAMLSRTDARASRSKSLSHSSIGLAIAQSRSPTEFKPFSKAGPCSMLSVDPLPQPRSLMLPDALPYHSDALSPCSPAAPSRFPSPYDGIDERSLSRDAAPSASAYDLPFDAYSGYIDEYPEDTVTIQADSPIHSSDPPLPSSDTLTNLQHSLYTKPGPGYYASHSVYFDSPAEDPRLSDPLDPEDYTVDWGDLDFHWKPFLRGHSGAIYGEDADKHISVRLSPIPVQHHEGVPTVDVSALQPPPHSSVDKPRPISAVQSVGEEEEPEESESVAVIGVYADSYPRFVQRVTTPRTPMNNSQARAEPVDPVRPGDSDSPMTNSPPWETYSQYQQVVHSRSPSVCSRLTPEGEGKPVFAPAPGIFISPLQGSDRSSSSPSRKSTDGSLQFGLDDKSRRLVRTDTRRIGSRQSSACSSVVTGTDPPSSQVSKDSIESWDE